MIFLEGGRSLKHRTLMLLILEIIMIAMVEILVISPVSATFLPVGPVSPQNPINGAIIPDDQLIIFSWTAAPNIDQDGIVGYLMGSYDLVASSDPSFTYTDPFITLTDYNDLMAGYIESPQTSYTVYVYDGAVSNFGHHEDDIVYWRVRGCSDAYSEWGPWSDVMQFSILRQPMLSDYYYKRPPYTEFYESESLYLWVEYEKNPTALHPPNLVVWVRPFKYLDDKDLWESEFNHALANFNPALKIWAAENFRVQISSDLSFNNVIVENVRV